MEEDAAPGSYGAGGSGRQAKGKEKEPVQPVRLTQSDDYYPTDLPKGAPTDFDWCTHSNVVREVIDQGVRRTCWTIASNRSFSGRLVVEKRFPKINLSARHLLMGLADEVDATCGLKKLEEMKKYMIDHGTVSEEDCSCSQKELEKALEKKKQNKSVKLVPCSDKGKSKVHAFKVEDFVIEKNVDEKELIRLLLGGPVAVCINVYDEFKRFKGDGVYTGPAANSKLLDQHLFLLVGYGTRREDGVHYWKVQNSAGTTWGKDGYGKIIRQISHKGATSLFTSFLYPKLLPHYEGQM